MNRASVRLVASLGAVIVILLFLVPGIASTAPAPSAIRIAHATTFGPMSLRRAAELLGLFQEAVT